LVISTTFNKSKNKIMTLDQLANKYGTDKGSEYPQHNKHGYAEMYEREYLGKWRNDSIRLLEIGVYLEVGTGAESVMMWYDYFQKASIFTFDIVDMTEHEKMLAMADRVSFFRGDQGKREDFEAMYEAFGSTPFDFILEDGSHTVHHQMISLGHLFQYVKSGGIYMLEDLSIPGHDVCCIRNDENYDVIRKFKETGKIESDHILPAEKAYLENNVKSIEIYPDCQDAYAVAILTKK
jgi:hypothetical protein